MALMDQEKVKKISRFAAITEDKTLMTTLLKEILIYTPKLSQITIVLDKLHYNNNKDFRIWMKAMKVVK